MIDDDDNKWSRESQGMVVVDVSLLLDEGGALAYLYIYAWRP